MTTDNHLNSFAELDCETTENHSKTAEELLNVENLDFDNTRYLARYCLSLKGTMNPSSSLKGHYH